jgi:hypothetical protein
MQEKVQKGDFLKKPLRELNFFGFVLGSYESLAKAWHAKLEAGIFWPSKNLNRQCEFLHSKLLHFFHPSTGL